MKFGNLATRLEPTVPHSRVRFLGTAAYAQLPRFFGRQLTRLWLLHLEPSPSFGPSYQMAVGGGRAATLENHPCFCPIPGVSVDCDVLIDIYRLE